MKNQTHKDPMNLSVLAVNIVRTKYDWNTHEGDGWSIVLPDPSALSRAQCMAILDSRSELEDCQKELGSANNDDLWRYFVVGSDKFHVDDFRPILDFYYDIPALEDNPSPSVMQHRLRSLPVVIVLVDGEPKLAVNEDVKNVSMEICWAYTLLGFLPPFIAIDIPESVLEIEPFILSACERTIEIVEFRCAFKREIVERLKESRAIDPRQLK